MCALAMAIAWSGCQDKVQPRRSGLTPAQEVALRSVAPAGKTDIPLELLTPADGAVVPRTFPALMIRWRDGARSTAFRVRVLAGGRRVLERLTSDRTLTLNGEAWAAVVAAAGSRGEVSLEIVAGAWLHDGQATLAPAVVTSTFRLSGAAEHPTGSLIYGRKLRPASAAPGPIHADNRSVVLTQVPMDGSPARTLLDGIRGVDAPLDPQEREASPVATRSVDFSGRNPPKGVAAHAVDADRGTRRCFSCHTASADGTYLAVASQADEVVPPGWDSSQGVLHVIRRSDDHILKRLPDAAFPRFHPSKPGLMMYSRVGGSFSVKQQVAIYYADLAVIDVEAKGPGRSIPGADDPERCELLADWSPDGETIVFSRSLPRTPCRGTRGQLDLWTIRYNGGEGGTAKPLEGAAGNGRSNVQPRYSPDGRWIVFYAADRGFFARGTADLLRVPATGGAAATLSVSTPAMESWHAFSPSGRWLAFVTNRERVDQPRLYLTRFNSEDGSTSPAVAVPGAAGDGTHVHTFDWGP